MFLRAFAIHKRRDTLAASTLYQYRCDLSRRVDRCLASQPTNPHGRRLQKRYAKIQDHLFLFLEDATIPPTNNASEQAIRMSTVFRKVTNGFRSDWGRDLFAAVRSSREYWPTPWPVRFSGDPEGAFSHGFPLRPGLSNYVPQAQVPLTRDGTLLPELLDRLVIHGIAQLHKQDAGEFAVVEAISEGFEPIDISCRTGSGMRVIPPLDDHLGIVGEQSQHAPLPKPAGQGPHGGGVSPGLLRPWLRRPVSEEDHRATHLIAPLGLVYKLELQLREVVGRHPHSSPVQGIQAGGLIAQEGHSCHGSRRTFARRLHSALV